jgi:hypothetical protein
MSLRSILLVGVCLAASPGTETATAYTDLCAGPRVPQVSGPIHNGSACNLKAEGATIEVVLSVTKRGSG